VWKNNILAIILTINCPPPFLLIPNHQRPFLRTSYTPPGHNRFQLLKLRKQAILNIFFSSYSHYPSISKEPTNIKSTLIPPNHLIPVLNYPILVQGGNVASNLIVDCEILFDLGNAPVVSLVDKELAKATLIYCDI